MSKTLNRRDFIKISGAGLGALALSGPLMSVLGSDKYSGYLPHGKIE